MDTDVVIVGAGLAGLSAARTLRAEGREWPAGARRNADVWMGYMDGAVRSADRAVGEARALL